MRKQNYGRIINLSSISGSFRGPTQSIYSSTKSAVIMLSEALNYEVEEFNIKVCAICTGGVRTDFLDSSSLRKPEKVISDYNVVIDTLSGYEKLNHNQSGYPKLVAKAIIEVFEMDNPPKRLYLGSGAISALQYKINNIVNEVNEFIELSKSTDIKN